MLTYKCFNGLATKYLVDKLTKRSSIHTRHTHNRANEKLHKIGFIPHEDCIFCKSESETLTHLLYHTRHTHNRANEKLHKIGFIPHEDCTFCKSKSETLTHLLYHTRHTHNRANEKLHKIGFIPHVDCTFCKSESETLTHLLYHCPFFIALWRDFEAYWSLVKNEQIHLTLEDIIVGIIKRPCLLLNYFLLIVKLYLWDCRRNQSFPSICGFKAKIKVKDEIEAYIARKSNKIGFLQLKWANCFL